ncbi:MAG: aminotransferase class I/II-fold pyridoxal phosphate-dependent enzyme [Gemmataceae bacterium]|nr:aminotransferase class I/II-fold pyridoxal phosphate-dependent enzyme [Gemmataceae bacterium]
MIIDLRSDTVTKPTEGMRAAMAAAEVGDDVYREDPTIIRLEERVASLLGKEAALFVPSGSMSNQVAIKAHTSPGDEILLDEYCHIYNWESGGPALLSGVTCRTIHGEWGILRPEQLADKVRPINDHMVRTRVVCLENTHNHGGGRIFPLETIRTIEQWARKNDLIMHLDGARLWNAAVATGIPLAVWASHFDSISVCFSKGLGAPVGSALAGPADFIDRARRYRKVFGGAMRQAGVIAAAALYAIDHHIPRLAEDHANAQILAETISLCPGLKLAPPEVHTNLVWFEVGERHGSAKDLAGRFKERGLLVGVDHPRRLRACTHLDASRADIEKAAGIIKSVCC